MPLDAETPPLPDPEAPHQPGAPSFGDKVRNFMLSIGAIGLELASLGSAPAAGDHANHEPIGESKRAKTWWGRILQWTWAILVFLIGVVALLFLLAVGLFWVLSWFY